MTDFSSLTTLAAKGGGGSILISYGLDRWSYPGAPIGAGASNLRMPAENVGRAMIDAAVASEEWVVVGRDSAGRPSMVAEATSAIAKRGGIQPHEFGTPALATNI